MKLRHLPCHLTHNIQKFRWSPIILRRSFINPIKTIASKLYHKKDISYKRLRSLQSQNIKYVILSYLCSIISNSIVFDYHYTKIYCTFNFQRKE